MENEKTRHRLNYRKGLIKAAILVFAASLATRAMTIDTEAVSIDDAYESYKEIAQTSIVDISWEEYKDLLRMTMSESGYCSYDMMNGCASAAINQSIQNECSMEETLYRPGAFGDGTFCFRAPDGKWRPVEMTDINDDVLEAVNDALLGTDVTEGAIGFFAPEYCSEDTIEYFLKHISGLKKVENVIFFREWD